MLRLSLSLQDLSVLRFALSPLWEVVASVRVLKDPAGHTVHLPWVKRVRERLPADGAELELLWSLIPVPTRLLPGFLAPTPRSPLPDVDEEIDAVLEVPAAVVRREVAGVFGTNPPPAVAALARDPRAGLAQLVEQLHRYWAVALAGDWPRIRGLLEGDLMHRARQLADGGPQRLFADLSSSVTWADGTLSVHPDPSQPHTSAEHVLAGRGLVLVPSAFTWPRVFVKADEDWPPVLRYPARAIASLWDAVEVADDGVAGVIGRARAVLLAELEGPATTTELARRTGLAPGGVSAHLAKLRAAGLVDSHRAGRVVLYSRTRRADALLAPR